MKAFSQKLKRIVALVLAAALSVSLVVEGGVLYASAEEVLVGTVTTDGAVLAQNYAELTAAEQALLCSGLLAEGSYTYLAPNDQSGLIAVDADRSTVTVSAYTALDQSWTPVSADIVVAGEVVEELTLDDSGKAVYTYDGNAFSVQVEYALRRQIDTALQQELLSTGEWLRQGVANLEAMNAQSSNLYMLETAMPELVKLANLGIALPFGGTASLSDEAKAAINELNADMRGNGGQFALSTMLADYAAGSKTEYLLNQGEDIHAALTTFVSRLKIVGEALNTITSNLQALSNMGLLDATTANQVKTLNGIVSELYSNLSVVAAADRTAAEKGTALVKAGISGAEYLRLDRLVLALDATTQIELIRNPLTIASACVQYNMSMYDVTVEVRLEGVENADDSAALVTYAASAPVTLTLAAGATRAEVEAAVAASGAEQAALNEWTAAGLCDPTQFDRVVTDVGDTLESDLSYTVTYTPKTYTVTLAYNNDTQVSYPYGYRLTLVNYSGSERVYDYTVNGEYVAQGSVYIISGDAIIQRTVGRPYTQGSLYQIAAGIYSSDAEAAVLTSGALLGDAAVYVRYPDKDATEQYITLEENVLTVSNYPSSYLGMDWVPYSYTVVTGSDKNTYYFNRGKNTVTLTESGFDRVDVVYVLELSNFSDSQVLELINLPYTLNEQAKTQKAALDSLAKYRNEMGQLDRTKLGALNGVIEYSNLTDEMKVYFKGVVSEIIGNCLDTDGKLKVYNMLGAYADPANGGLTYYYQNSDALIYEITVLSDYLSAMLADDEKQAALTTLVTDAGYADYADKISVLEGAMSAVKSDLIPPHSAINTDSANLYKLTAALGGTGFRTYSALAEELALYSTTFSVSATTTAFLSFELTIDGETYNTEPLGIEKTDLVTAGHVTALLAAVEQIRDSKISADKMPFYQSNYAPAQLRADLVGMTGLEAMRYINALDLSWKARVYTVNVEGMEPQYVDINNLQVKLATSPTVDELYQYVIDGRTVSAGSYTFTPQELKELFVDDTLEVELIVQSVRRENLISMVDKLNAAVNDDNMIFALVEYAGDYSIIMRVDASDSAAVKSSMMSAAMGMVNSGYSYIALDDQPVLSLNADNSLEITLQSAVEALLRSGVGTDTIIAAMNADGTINDMTIDGRVISLTELPTVGAELIATTMQLGNNALDATNVDFYITLGAASGDLVSLRNQLDGELGRYFSLICEDGEAKVSLTLPEQAYQYYLALLLFTDGLELTDIDAVNGRIAFTFLQDLLSPVLREDVSVQAYLNTMEKLGMITDAQSRADYEGLYDYLCQVYNGMTFTYDDDSCLAVGSMPIKDLLDGVGGSMADMVRTMVAEYESGLTMRTRVTLTNIGTEYNALYVDAASGDSMARAGLTVLSGDVRYDGGAVVVLLNDMDADLTFNGSALLNLNGYTLRGNVVCNGSVSIVDTSAVADGAITGTVTGNYTRSAEAYYDLTKTANGNLTLSVDAGFLAEEWDDGRFNALVTDVIADLVFNGYASNMLTVNGEEIYQVEIRDLVGLMTDADADARLFRILCGVLDTEALEQVVNAILRDIADFEKLERAVRSGSPILSYQLTTAPWLMTTEYMAEGDYITVHLLSGESRQRTLDVVVTGSDADQALLADLLEVMDSTTTLELQVDLNQTTAGNTLIYQWQLDSAVEVNMTNNVQYAIAVCVLLADGMGAPENEALLNGIRSFYETRSLAKLEQAYNAMTSEQALNAIARLENDRMLDEILAGLGLADLVEFDRLNMNAVLAAVKQVASLTRMTGIQGKPATMGSFYNAELGGYELIGEDVSQVVTTPLFGSYSSSLELTMGGCRFVLKLFNADLMEYDIVVYKGSDDPIYEGSDLTAAFNKIIGNGYTVRINADELTMSGSIMVAYQVTIKGADAIDQAGCSFLLSVAGASIHSDAKLAVYSSMDGYIVRRSGAYDYTLREVDAPVTSAPVAESWVDTLTSGSKTTRYLFLDLDPTAGMTFKALKGNMKFKDLTGYELTISLEGNDGSQVVKTGDRMIVEVQLDGVIETIITYTVIVMGDTNCTGTIESGDAVVMQDIYNGNSRNYAHTILLAADCNKTGTVAFPAVESGDAVRIMHKYFDWESYLESLRKQ